MPKRPSEVIGDVIARLIPLLLMLWAAIESDSFVLRVLLCTWIGFTVLLWALVAAGLDVAGWARKNAEAGR